MATVHQGVAYLTGQVPADETLDADVGVQTASVLSRIDALLAQVGSSKERVLSATVFLTEDGPSFDAMNAVYDKWVSPGAAPARTTVTRVGMANPKWKVEIQIIASVK